MLISALNIHLTVVFFMIVDCYHGYLTQAGKEADRTVKSIIFSSDQY